MYIEGFLVPVPKKKVGKYKKFSKIFGGLWIKHGALEYSEFLADDLKKGKLTSFPRSLKLKSNETMCFSWAMFKNKAHRKSVMSKVMNDPKMQALDPKDWPFDGMRMIFGGFKSFMKLR